jgi:hypothetical protein
LIIALLFSLLAGGLSYFIVHFVASRRIEKNAPVLGWWRGAIIALAVFVAVVLIHTLIFPGQGGFIVSALPVLFIGLAMFGWLVAIVGALVGVVCERKFFA